MDVLNRKNGLIARPTGIENKFAYSLIIVDDEPAVCKTIEAILREDGYERIYAASGKKELYQLLEHTDPSLILMDLNLGKSPREGLDLMEEIDSEGKIATNYIVISGNDDNTIMLEAFRKKAIDFLLKPIDPNFLKCRVEKALVDIEFRMQALTDSMTKIANKRTFLECTGLKMKEFHRYRRPTSLLVFDIDHFKRYNDTYGHLEGDYVLKKLANFFSISVRGTDLVGRFGGEEFVMLFPDTNFDAAHTAYKRLYLSFKQIAFRPTDNETEQITLSAGISTIDDQIYHSLFGEEVTNSNSELTPETVGTLTNLMIRCADKGLYEIKGNGRNDCNPYNCLEKFGKEVLTNR
jgi:diguanylate cyclase (GGDEF)-like protein